MDSSQRARTRLGQDCSTKGRTGANNVLVPQHEATHPDGPARACLWDRHSPEYKDRLARDRAWADIFSELDPAYSSASASQKHEIGLCITKKWYNVRDSYVKSMKPGYLGSRRNRPYIHSDLLRFLDDRYFEKIKRKCSSTQQGAEQEDDTEEVETEPWDHEVFVSIDETEEANPNKRLKLEYSEDSLKGDNLKVKEEEDIVAVLSNLIQKEEDEDRAFFKSITPSVKKLSEDSKFEFRIQVMKLIKTLRAKDKNRIDLKTERISNNDSETE
ncbi:uncharacterized protein [Choristoneura fumiferana]|uniref:uncharacterized protein n=1 Tax=Choristoneura fumiferana TaxID=7141 RepID=UPI003D15D2A5